MLELETRLRRHAAQLEAKASPIDVRELRELAPARRVTVPVHVSHRKLVVAIAILALGLIAAGIAYGLRSSIVEPGRDVGWGIELALAPDGKPFLVYYDRDRSLLTFAKCTDSGCEQEPTLTRVVGSRAAVGMRPDGLPLVWIHSDDESGGESWIADCADAACTDFTRSQAPELGERVHTVTPGGRLLATRNDADGRLVIATCRDVACSTGIAETAIGQTQWPDFVEARFDENERPVLLYATGDRSELRLLRCLAPDCQNGYTQQVIAQGDVDQTTPFGFTLDDSSRPWIIHGRHGLSVVRCADDVCGTSTSTRLGESENAYQVEAFLDSDGMPLFVYRWAISAGSDVVKVAWCADSACEAGTIATIYEGGDLLAFSATLAAAGLPVIAHHSAAGVIVTSCADAGCLEGALDVAQWDATAPTTTTIAEPAVGGWTRVGTFTELLGPDAVVTDASSSGDVVVLVGRRCEGDRCSAATWVSEDGHSWASSTIDSDGLPTHVAAGSSGFVARIEECDDPDSCSTELWSSRTGAAWTKAIMRGCEGPSPPISCSVDVEQLEGGPVGYALLGMPFEEPQPILWVSADGTAWETVDLGLGGFGEAVPNAVWITADRFVVQVNPCRVLEGGTYECRKRQWTSTDRATWVENEHELIGWLHQPSPAIGWSGGAVAFGYWIEDEAWITKVWASPDGLEWSVSPLEGLIAEMEYPSSLSETASGLLVIARGFHEPTATERAYVGTSADGLVWTVEEHSLDEFPPGSTFQMAQLGKSALVVAAEGNEIWIWSPTL